MVVPSDAEVLAELEAEESLAEAERMYATMWEREQEEAVPLPDLRTPEDEHYPEPWGDDDEF